MNSIVTERFIKCLDKLKEDGKIRSSRQFAMSLDYLPQSLSEIQKGRRDVTIELLRKSVETYELNPIYLFTGEGTMFLSGEHTTAFRQLTVVTDGFDDERIVHVPIPAQSGYAGEVIDPVFLQSLPTYTLPDYKYKVGTHRSFDVSGDSMEPTLFEGDKVICSYLDPLHWESGVKDNNVYVIVTRGDVLVKRILNHLKAGNIFLVHSDNEFYGPYSIPKEDVREIWYVRAKLSPFLPSPNNIQNIVRTEVKELKSTIVNQGMLVENLYKMIENMTER